MMDLIAASSAAVAAVFLGLRAQMLKPDLGSWPDAPKCVLYASFGLSAMLGAYPVAVMNGYQPSTGEVALFPMLALYAFLLWLNLYRQARRQA